MGVGLFVFLYYLFLMPTDVLILYGSSGFINSNIVSDVGVFPNFSFFSLFDQDWQTLSFHYFFVILTFCFFIGWQTRWVKWMVFIGFLSYFNWNDYLYYGVDTVLVALLLLLCLAPIGSTLSADRIRKVRAHKNKLGLNARLPLPTSQRGFACQRLIQLQMAAIFFSSGIEKLRFEMWWEGIGPWIALNDNEVAFFPVDFFAEYFWVLNLMAFGTLLIEISYAFLIWGYKTRPYLLTAAISLHFGIAIMMGMYYFAAIMICGHLAFVHRHWYAQAGQWWCKKIGKMEMIYDGECGFCKRAMAAFLAFDGMGQITVRDYRTNPSPDVSSEEADKALYVVTDEILLNGFDAYRFVVLRVPGLWWQIPFFYIPFVSKAAGRPIYHWIAANRGMVSQYVAKPTKFKSDN